MPKNTQIIVNKITDIGQALRERRKKSDLTQAQAAAISNVGTRFLSDLENGKETLQAGKIIQVLKAFGLVLALQERGLPDP